jgi:hypothetical protein
MSDTLLPPKSPCQGGCQAPLADIQAALSSIREDLDKVITAVNSVGDLAQSHHEALSQIVAAVGQFQAQFAHMNPMAMLKGLVGGRNG